jgi:transketolase
MRNLFLDLLYSEMEKNDKIYFLTADMGINLVEKFEKTFPKRYLNVGIAEQNLIGVAAGLAESGLKPFVYTISNFLTQRCFEQIRNDVVLHDLPITMVGTSTGFDNAPLGPTHHMLDDWGSIASLPKIRIGCPFDSDSVKRIFTATINNPKPSYIRIPKGIGYSLNQNVVPDKKNDQVIVSYGSATQYAIEYSKSQQIPIFLAEWLGMEIFGFLDSLDLKNYKKITVIEDHFANTGMYSYVCQWKNITNSKLEIKSVSPSNYQATIGADIFDFMEKIL